MRHVREHGVAKDDRTGTGTRSVFGYQMRFDLREGFPLVTTKKVHLQVDHPRAAVVPARRHQHRTGCRSTASRSGTNGPTQTASSGPVYGVQWRSWPTPDGGTSTRSRDVVDRSSATRFAPHHRERLERGASCRGWRWRPATRSSSSTCADGRAVSCQLYQRSADIFLGVPFNIASYALLTHMLAQRARSVAGDLIWTGAIVIFTSTTWSRLTCKLSRTPHPLPARDRSAFARDPVQYRF